MIANKNFYSTIKFIFPYLGFALIVLSAKLIVIANYGNATLQGDQWSEASKLYLPFLTGDLTWSNLFASHNEHRIFTSRLLSIAIFYLNGEIWNPILQMQVNAVIHTFALTVLLVYITKNLSPILVNILLLFCTIMLSIPFGAENTLGGFQSPFYFLLLFSFIFLWSMSIHATYSSKWWWGIIAGMLGFLSLALATIAIIAGMLILIIRRYIFKDHQIAISAILMLTIMAIVMIILTPTSPNSKWVAKSLIEFLFAFAKIFSWPSSMPIGVFIVQTPILILSFYMLKNKEYQTPLPLFLIAISLWLFGIFATTAYGRAKGIDAPRYTDLFAIGLIANFVALFILFEKSQLQKQIYLSMLAGVWIATIAVSFVCSIEKITHGLKQMLDSDLQREKNVQAYICNGDFSHLQKNPPVNILYATPKHLKTLFDNPTIRNFLPGNIYIPNAKNPLDSDGKLFCKKYLPTVINTQLEKQENLKVLSISTCKGNIDKINGISVPKQFSIASILGVLNVHGWLAESKTLNSFELVSTVLVLTDAKGNSVWFNTQKQKRQDLATHFKNSSLSMAGFQSTIETSHLSAGNYTLGLGFNDGNSIKVCSQFKIPGIIKK